MDVRIIDPEVLAQAVYSSGRPLHINALVRAAIRACMEASQPRPYAPGNAYRVGENVLIAGQIATVETIQRGENPKQGSFTILTLRFTDGSQRFMAAEIPNTPVAEERPSIPEEWMDELLVEVEGLETALRQAIQDTLQDDPRFTSLQTFQGEIWCLRDMLPPVDSFTLQKVLTVIQQIPIGERELISYSTEELVNMAWGLTNDGSATYDLHAFALCRALREQGEVFNLRGRWTSSAAWTAFTARSPLTTPRVPTRLTSLTQAEIVSRKEKEIGRLGRYRRITKEAETEGKDREQDLETWRRGHPIQAIFVLRARHYYEGWLPLKGQVRRLFVPLTTGCQEVVFYHHFGDQPESFRAWVDWEKGRIWVSPEMHNIFRRYRIYPGARLRISARNEREYDIATRPSDRTDPIHVWRMWLDEEGEIQYEEHHEPRLYDVDDDVYVADVRFDDLQALFRQAEEVGNSVFGLMYEKVHQWWEEGGRKPLIVTIDQLFQAIHFDEKGRMVSKATIAWELWQRKAFESLGGGRYRFCPEFGTQKESPTPVRPSRGRPRRTVRLQPKVPPILESLREVAETYPEATRVVEWSREPEEVGPAVATAPVTVMVEEAQLEAESVPPAEPEFVATPVAESAREVREAPPEAAFTPIDVLLPEAEEARPEAELALSVEREIESAPIAEPVREAEEVPSEAEVAPASGPLLEVKSVRPEEEIAPTQPEIAILPAGELSPEVEACPAEIPSGAPVPLVRETEGLPPLSAVSAAPPCLEMAAPIAGKPARRHRIRRVYATFRSLVRQLVHRLFRRKACVPEPLKENPEPSEEL